MYSVHIPQKMLFETRMWKGGGGGKFLTSYIVLHTKDVPKLILYTPNNLQKLD